MQREIFLLRLESTKMVTPSVRHFAFRRDDNSHLSFTPGQFITFHFTMDEDEYQRSYSIASHPGNGKALDIVVSPIEGGRGTRFLFDLQPGDKVTTTGPFGRLILRDEQPARYILIATGVGVAPFHAMLPALRERIAYQNAKVILLQGVQRPHDLLFSDDFINFSTEHPDFEFRAYYSREYPDAPQPFENSGYVQTAFHELQLNPENDIVYLCGNPNMIDDSFTKLKEIGFTTKQVRREKYISPKR